MTIKYRENLIWLALLFYTLGVFWFSRGFHFSNLSGFWASGIDEKINFIVMLACILEATRNLMILVLRPDRIILDKKSIAIVGLFSHKVLDFSEITKVVLCFNNDNDSLGLKRKISIESIENNTANVSVVPLEFDAEKFVLELSERDVKVCFDD